MAPLHFRAWLPHEGEMHTVDSIQFDENDNAKVVKFGEAIAWDEENGGFGWEREAKDVVLMQSTGLKDRTGKEIFEGDILMFRASDMNEDAIGEVKFSGGAFIAVFAGFFFVNQICNDSEVIGNIYENPDLLKPSA